MAVLQDIIFFSRPGQIVPVSLKKLSNLLKIDRGPTVYIVSTSQGYYTASEALHKRVSGFLVARII
jgi:ribosomal protein S8